MSESASTQALATALRERLTVIADRDFYNRDPAGHLGKLQAVSEHLESVERGLPRPLDPELAHYLQRRSYDKALALLEAKGLA